MSSCWGFIVFVWGCACNAIQQLDIAEMPLFACKNVWKFMFVCKVLVKFFEENYVSDWLLMLKVITYHPLEFLFAKAHNIFKHLYGISVSVIVKKKTKNMHTSLTCEVFCSWRSRRNRQMHKIFLPCLILKGEPIQSSTVCWDGLISTSKKTIFCVSNKLAHTWICMSLNTMYG